MQKYWICSQTVTLNREIACCRDNYHKTMKTFILLIDLAWVVRIQDRFFCRFHCISLSALQDVGLQVSDQ
jgi:hypothetical protein